MMKMKTGGWQWKGLQPRLKLKLGTAANLRIETYYEGSEILTNDIFFRRRQPRNSNCQHYPNSCFMLGLWEMMQK